MYKFLQSKKGFTIVELMIVLVLMGFGVFAIANLFRAAYRSFDKTEERFVKQEAVKDVAEFLQKGVKITAAQTADVFPTGDVAPKGDTLDKSYSYLYAELKDLDEDGTYEGYYLYIQNASTKREDAKLISDIPMYISLDVHQDYKVRDTDLPPIEKEKKPNIDVKNQNGVIITIAALESGFDYGTPDSPNLPTGDEIYYSVQVAYHFPNMATSKTDVSVNFPHGDIGFTYNADGEIVEKANRNNGRAAANTYNDSGVVASSVTSVDKNGTALRVFCDSILDGDNSDANVNVPKMCFIATASYGGDSGEVGLLCDFRDKCLLTNAPGRLFVKTYYAISPPIADFIAQHETLRATVRTMLKPLIVVAEYSLNHELILESVPALILSFACGLPLSIFAVKYDKKRKHD